MDRHRGVRRYICALAVVCLAATPSFSENPERYDIVLSGGTILDGTGEAAYEADVGLVGDTIITIGDLSEASTDARIDVNGLLIVPGFIDLHSHADGPDDHTGLRSRNPKRRAAPNLVTQGITTAVVNQDGRSPQDIARQRSQLNERGMGINTVLMVGHNTIRRSALRGFDKAREATPEEIDRMTAQLRKGLDAGAYGMTAGLEYEPGIWSTTEELISLVKEIVPYSGVYIVHERSSGVDPMWVVPSQHDSDHPTMLDSVNEVIQVGESTGATVVATHIKARGTEFWGNSQPIIDAINAARDRGVNIYADQYPYTSSGSDGSIVLIPKWVLDEYEGEVMDFEQALLDVMKDPPRFEKLKRDIKHAIARRGGANRILIMRHPDRSFVGKSLAQIAYDKDVDPVQMVYLMQIEGYTERFGGAVVRGFSMDIEDVERFVKQPWVATASDAGIALREDGLIHARYYGTFPRKIRKFALDKNLISLEAAIHSMTGLPASIMGFRDRGILREGNKADIAILDLDALQDRATYFSPHQYASGVEFVFVNGQLVVAGGKPTYALPGVVITPESGGPIRQTDD
ncbi:MAG: amidohydrolase family protein [Candidatus Hydrogenedentota bacterium]